MEISHPSEIQSCAYCDFLTKDFVTLGTHLHEAHADKIANDQFRLTHKEIKSTFAQLKRQRKNAKRKLNAQPKQIDTSKDHIFNT